MTRFAAITGIAAALTALAGCAASPQPPVTVVRDWQRSNLLFARSVYELDDATQFAGRPVWPAVRNGYELERYDEAYIYRIDQPAFFERGGGGFQQAATTLSYRAIRR